MPDLHGGDVGCFNLRLYDEVLMHGMEETLCEGGLQLSDKLKVADCLFEWVCCHRSGSCGKGVLSIS